MNKNILLLPDKSLFDILIDCNVDLTNLNILESKLGKIIINKYLYHKMIESIKNKIDEYFIRQSWIINMSIYHDMFLSIIDEMSKEYNVEINAIKKDINKLLIMILKNIRKFNVGVAREDVSLIAMACIINQYTKFIPVIITDDSDLLIHGHFLCSYYGLTSPIYSTYELLRNINEKEILRTYLNYRDLKNINCYDLNSFHKKNDCISDLRKLSSKNLLSVHPCLESETNFKKSTRISYS